MLPKTSYATSWKERERLRNVPKSRAKSAKRAKYCFSSMQILTFFRITTLNFKLINSKNLTQCRGTMPKEPLDNSLLLYLRHLERKVCEKESKTKWNVQKQTAIENISFSIFYKRVQYSVWNSSPATVTFLHGLEPLRPRRTRH